MPLPKLTEKIVAATKPLEVGWSLLELMDVRSAKATSGNSMNTFFEFEAVSGPNSSAENKGRAVTMLINSAALEKGIFETCSSYDSFLCAITNTTRDKLMDVSIEEDALKGRKVWCDVQKRLVDGKTYWDFRQFMPDGEVPF